MVVNIAEFKCNLRDCLYGGELARFIYGISFLSSIKKVCYVAGKRLFGQVVFPINSDVKSSYRANVLILFNGTLMQI